MVNLLANLETIKLRIQTAADVVGRLEKDITLLAVSKTRSSKMIREVAQCGIRSFGENYLQEALEKMTDLKSLSLDWHFIGPIQSNKTRQIAENFSWVHSVDRIKIAQRLSTQRPQHMSDLNICMQVNIDNEPTKSGFKIDEIISASKKIQALPNIKLCGLMTIPAPQSELSSQRKSFSKLREILDDINISLDNSKKLSTLSMGMSADLESAVYEGATIVRIGTDIFGPRE